MKSNRNARHMEWQRIAKAAFLEFPYSNKQASVVRSLLFLSHVLDLKIHLHFMTLSLTRFHIAK